MSDDTRKYEAPKCDALDDSDLENIAGGMCAYGDSVTPKDGSENCYSGNTAVTMDCVNGGQATSGRADCQGGNTFVHFNECAPGQADQ